MAETEKQWKLEFPKTFDVCPHCGAPIRLSQAVTVGEFVNPEMKGKEIVMLTMVHMNKGPVTTVIALGHVDACNNCGTLFTIKQEKRKLSTLDLERQLKELGL